VAAAAAVWFVETLTTLTGFCKLPLISVVESVNTEKPAPKPHCFRQITRL
jgi:hypothetical protein